MLTSWHFGAGQDILGQIYVFLTKNRWKREQVSFEFVTKEVIVSHLDISNVDIIYKFRLFATNLKKKKKKWKSHFGFLWRN